MLVRPWKVRRASTRFVRIPLRYWNEIVYSGRREFRILDKQATRPQSLIAPSLIIGWRQVGSEYEAKPMVLERVWRERLGEISQASLESEGHFGTDAFEAFRHEWVERTHRRFDMMQEAWAVRLRPLPDSHEGVAEFAQLAFLHLAHLYDEHLPQLVRREAERIANDHRTHLESSELQG